MLLLFLNKTPSVLPDTLRQSLLFHPVPAILFFGTLPAPDMAFPLLRRLHYNIPEQPLFRHNFFLYFLQLQESEFHSLPHLSFQLLSQNQYKIFHIRSSTVVSHQSCQNNDIQHRYHLRTFHHVHSHYGCILQRMDNPYNFLPSYQLSSLMDLLFRSTHPEVHLHQDFPADSSRELH